MSATFKRLLAAGVAAAAMSSAIVSAKAGAFAIREQSAAAQGQGFAGAAAGTGGLASMFWNPAIMTSFSGWQSAWSFSAIVPSSKTTTLPGTSPALTGANVSNDVGQSALVGGSNNSYQINDNIWVGLNIGAPFGLVTKNAPAWRGGFYGQTSRVFSTDINPNIAYKINEMFSVAAGIQIEYFRTRLTSSSPPPFPATRVVQLEGDSWGVGYTLGATFKPFAGTVLGVGYRSRIEQKVTGNLFNVPSAVLPAALSIKSTLTLPDQLTLGLTQRINDQLSLSAGFEWTHWSLFNSFPVIITAPAPLAGISPTSLAFRYQNGWLASVGGAYKWNDQLTLRAGLSYEKSPITDTTRSVRLTDNTRISPSVGIGYKYSEKLSFDASYTHSFFRKSPIRITSAANPAFVSPALSYVATNSTALDLLSLQINYRWDDPKVAIPVVPIVRKY